MLPCTWGAHSKSTLLPREAVNIPRWLGGQEIDIFVELGVV